MRIETRKGQALVFLIHPTNSQFLPSLSILVHQSILVLSSLAPSPTHSLLDNANDIFLVIHFFFASLSLSSSCWTCTSAPPHQHHRTDRESSPCSLNGSCCHDLRNGQGIALREMISVLSPPPLNRASGDRIIPPSLEGRGAEAMSDTAKQNETEDKQEETGKERSEEAKQTENHKGRARRCGG